MIETGGVFCEVRTKSEETVNVVNTVNEHSQVVQDLRCLTLKEGTDSLCRNVGNYQPTLRNTPEERRPLLHRGESLKSHMSGL
jgi:hypothetical protein